MASHGPRSGNLEYKIFLMFGTLIAFIIFNGIYSSYRWNSSTTQKIDKDLSNKLTIAQAVLSNEQDKLDSLASVILEQKAALLERVDFDDYRTITILLQQISVLHDIDLLLLLDDQGALLASNKLTATPFPVAAHRSLLANLQRASGLEMVSPDLFQFKFPDYYQRTHHTIPYLCVKTVIPLVYDSGDMGGHIVMLKLLNTRPDLLRKMSELSGAQIFIYDEQSDQQRQPILASFDASFIQQLADDYDNQVSKNPPFFIKHQNLPVISTPANAKLAVALDSQIFEQQRNQLIISNVLPFLVTVAVSALLFYFLKIRIFNKITELIHTLREVTAGNLEVRLKSPTVAHTPDEITKMGLNFNTMMARLQDSYNQLDHNSRELGTLNQQLTEEIIERKNTEVALLEAKREAEAANQLKSLFLANMSHEIRTPMNAILGYAQILQRDSSLTVQQRDGINTIRQSGLHLLNLINDILDISKIEAGRMELKSADFSLSDLLQDLSAMFKLRCLEKNLRWQLEIPPHLNPILVHGDESKLKQVLINLLGNAVKFTESGQVILRLTALPNNQYEFAVIDTGKGIPQHAQQLIFIAFQQDEQGLKKGGTGLGLAIASKQVELMQSQLQVTSSLGQGACFYFTLTLPPAHSEQFTRNTATHLVSHLQPGQSVTALVVDDTQVNRDVLANLLTQIGVTVIQAEDGLDALAKLEQATPDIVFMDYRMPKLNGVETIRRITARYHDTIKRVMVSASVFDTADEFKQCGCDAVITKPFRLEEIYGCLQTLLAVDYVYVEDLAALPNATSTESAPAAPDWSTLTLPAELYRVLLEAAEFGFLTDLEQAITTLMQMGSQEQHLARQLTQSIRHYDLESILSLLKEIPHDEIPV